MYTTSNKWTTAKKQEFNGHLYDSKFESGYAQELELRLKAKDIKGYATQQNLDLIVNGYVVCQYRIDFVIFHNDDTIEYVETKGYPITKVWVLKFKIFEALYSGKENVKITVVYQGKHPKLRKMKKYVICKR